MAWNNNRYLMRVEKPAQDCDWSPRIGATFPRSTIAVDVKTGFIASGTVLSACDGSGSWIVGDCKLYPVEQTDDGWLRIEGAVLVPKNRGRSSNMMLVEVGA